MDFWEKFERIVYIWFISFLALTVTLIAVAMIVATFLHFTNPCPN